MKKIYAVNGSPRKNGNTAQLLQKALDGGVSGLNPSQFPADLAKTFEMGRKLAE